MGLGLLFAFFAFRKAHKLPGGRTMAAILMLVGVSAYEVFTGHPLVTRASAIIGVVTESLTGGGTITFSLSDAGGQEAFVVNNTSGSVNITSISVPPPDSFTTPNNSPQCQVGTVLAPGAGCYVQLVTLMD
jgi:TM2 domain-containing membrane protein YozV